MEIKETNLTFVTKLSMLNNPDSIVLHHAAADNVPIETIHKWHVARGWSGIGYHYYVRKNGSIFRGRPEKAIGAHCPGKNADSIGICAEGNFENDVMPAVQKEAIIHLIKDIKKRYNIKEIAPHKKYKATACPGKNYPLENIISESNKIDIAEVISIMDKNDIKALQEMFNKLGIKDNSGKVLDVDGIEGKCTKEAKARLKELIAYVLR